MTDRAATQNTTIRSIPYHQNISHVSATDGGRVFAGVNIHHGHERPLHEILPNADQAPFDSSSRQDDPSCLEDTRTQVLKQIRAWVYGEDSSCIFWLNGMAGTGKSTIARTVAEEFSRRKCLGASFFFVRGGGHVSHAGMFFTSIAVQLAIRQPNVKEHIIVAVQQEPGIASKSRTEQWRQLIAQPLQKTAAQTAQPVVVLVIDALDECDNDNDMKGLVAVLAQAGGITAVRLRVIITSRPETPIRLGFKRIPEILHRDLLLHEVPREVVDADICLFFYDQLGEVRDMYDLPEEWPGVDHVNQLVSVSAGLFIFAATVCRFVQKNDMSAEDALALFLPKSKSYSDDEGRGETTRFLDAMYSQILNRSRAPTARRAVEGQAPNPGKETLGAIAALSEPLPVEPLAKLLHVRPSDIGQYLSRFHSVVRVPAAAELPIRLFHASLRDFLFDPQRSSSSGFWVDEGVTHGLLANLCLRRLSDCQTFKSDICSVTQPGTQRAEVSTRHVAYQIPPDIAYACSYWPWHFANSRERLRDNGEVHRFLKTHFLHWLEALSWLGRLSSAVTHINDLLSITQEIYSSEVIVFLKDAKRFVLKNRYVIDLAPLQIYHSAMIFTPTQSVVRNTFYGQVSYLWARIPDMPMQWSAEIFKLEGHDDKVAAVAFSPDGLVVASGSYDHTVRLWSAQTGEQTQKLEGHDSYVAAVAFSPDGQILASASWDETVRLWNAQTGMQMRKLEGHDKNVAAVAFSPDGLVVASAADDKTVRLWNAQTGEQTGLITVAACIREMTFSTTGDSLRTDKGSFVLADPFRNPEEHNSIRMGSLELTSQWIRSQGKGILWLPHEYRGSCSAMHGQMLVIGQASGPVTIFQLM